MKERREWDGWFYKILAEWEEEVGMDRILHPDFQLVIGTGRRSNRQDLLREARSGSVNYEVQDEETGSQKVLVTGNTAIVTAKLRIKGTLKGEPFDRTLWFSDTYVRTSSGWRYFFGQASLPLPSTQQ